MKRFLLLIAGALLAGTTLSAADNSMSAEALSPEHQQWLDAAAAVLEEEIARDPIMAVVYMAEEYPLYSQPGQQGEMFTSLSSGTTVFVQDVEMTDSAEYQAGFDTWYQVSAWQGGSEYVGYVNRAHLAISDEDFLQWEIDFGTNPEMYEMMLLTEEAAIDYSDVEQFPASYQPYLLDLKEKHSKWFFVPQMVDLDWDYVVQEELKSGRSLIETSKGGYMYDGVYSPGWGYATEDALEYYLDPRNGLAEDKIFQFEQLTYNTSYHTENALKIFLDKTFMGNGALMPETSLTYSYGIWAIGAEATQNVSPFHLAARIYQEQGKGTSPLISGTYPGYEGYYNFFNVKASGTTAEDIIVNGLAYAKSQNWCNGYYSILGGAKILAKNYIRVGQDTVYLQKYDVVGATSNGLFGHQYMQNIVAPTSEGINTYKLYRDSNALDNTFVFKIPVYNNMPKSVCAYPTEKTTVYNGVDYATVFDAKYYHDNNSDVANVLGSDPVTLLQHFVINGMDEGRQASPEFNVDAYKNNNPDVVAVFGENTKEYYHHYINCGKAEGRDAVTMNSGGQTSNSATDYSAVFDAEYYFNNNPDVAAALGNNENYLLEHFVANGMEEGRQASSEFNVNAYKNNNPDVVAAFGENTKEYYLHYINHGRAEGRDAVTIGQGNQGLDSITDYSAVFDAEYYYSNNEDVANALGKDVDVLLQHFIANGMDEGRQGCAGFNVNVYKENNADLSAAFADNLKEYYLHYISFGMAEGRIAY